MISLTASIDKEGIIGDSSIEGLPWHCSLDLQMFRWMTWGADVVVGRKTWEELPESVRTCNGRTWHVVSREPTPRCHFWPQVKALMGWKSHVVVAGGASIYDLALRDRVIDRVFLTRLPIDSGGDVEWPGLPDGWEKVRSHEQLCKIEDVSGWYAHGDYRTETVRFEEWVEGSDGG